MCFIDAKYANKCVCSWGSAPNPAYSAPPGSLAGFKGPTSKGRGWKGKERGSGEREGEGQPVLFFPHFKP